jgi:hypothetical protein
VIKTFSGYMRGLDHIPSFDSDKSSGVFCNEKGAAAQDKRLPGEPHFAVTPGRDWRAPLLDAVGARR